MRRAVQALCGFAVIAAIFYSSLWTLSFLNRVYIYRHRDNYQPDTFLVIGVEYGTEGGDEWCLNGTVSGQNERLVPCLRGAPRPHSLDDVLARYPNGTKIEVLFNPKATDTLVQGESLRVLSASPDFWQEEARLRHRLGLRVLVAFPLTLAIYLAVRYLNRRPAGSYA